MKKDIVGLGFVSTISVIIGAVIFVVFTMKLSIKENQIIMWATGGLALMSLGVGFIYYLLARKS